MVFRGVAGARAIVREDLVVVREERRTRHVRARVAVGARHPAFAAHVPHAARPAPAALLGDHLHAVRELERHAVRFRHVHGRVEDRGRRLHAKCVVALRVGVGAPVSDDARAEVVVLHPAREVVVVVRTPRTRPEPGVPVKLLARRLLLRREPLALEVEGRAEVEVRIHLLHLAEAAEAQQLVADDEVRLAQALDAGLVDAAVLLRRGDDGLSFAHGHRGRLFAVHVLARAHREYGRGRVPAVARRDVDGVDVLAREHFAHVDVHLAVLVAVVRVGPFLDALAAFLPHVADRDELHVLLRQHPAAEHAAAAPSESDAGHHDAVGRRHLAVEAQCRCRRQHWQRHRAACAFQKRSPTAFLHGQFSFVYL